MHIQFSFVIIPRGVRKCGSVVCSCNKYSHYSQVRAGLGVALAIIALRHARLTGTPCPCSRPDNSRPASSLSACSALRAKPAVLLLLTGTFGGGASAGSHAEGSKTLRALLPLCIRARQRQRCGALKITGKGISQQGSGLSFIARLPSPPAQVATSPAAARLRGVGRVTLSTPAVLFAPTSPSTADPPLILASARDALRELATVTSSVYLITQAPSLFIAPFSEVCSVLASWR